MDDSPPQSVTRDDVRLCCGGPLIFPLQSMAIGFRRSITSARIQR